ncbi:hypothetical protein P3S67_000152 [Capsicum chacoense]
MNIAILLRYSGKWRFQTEYADYKSEEIVVAESVNYVRLISLIADGLNIDGTRKNIDVSYVVDNNDSPFHIHKCQEDILLDRETGVVVCLEGVESDAMALFVVETQNQYALYVLEVEIDNLICDSKSIDVKVKQMYKDK